jgi:dihydropteroate synthase
MEYVSNGKIITFNKPLIMAILNVTPDSFYDGGKYSTLSDIINDAEEKINQGANIIDIGAASSRPGAIEISEEEERNRLKDILPELRRQFPKIIISVDTYRSAIAKRSADCGADIINDVSSGTMDDKMFATIADLNVIYVLMHMQGIPKTMQQNPTYANVTLEVKNEFERKLEILKKLKVTKIILDPGFGFGKTVENNFELLKNLLKFVPLGYPILAGVSRKSMINKIIGTNPVTALNGTTVLNTIALLNGASILRVHDVLEAKQAIDLVEFYKDQESNHFS